MIVRGRVVDEAGRPVAGARVILDLDHAFLPATGQKRPAWRDEPPTAASGPAGDYQFDVPREDRGPFRQEGRALLAFDGERVSRKLVVEWTDATVAAPDLVLERGIVGRVRVLWEDGAPAAGASAEVWLNESTPEGGDPREGIHVFGGVTDDRGEIGFGPVLDREYRRIFVRTTHPDAPSRSPWWDNVRVSPTEPIEFSLTRGRTVRGRVLAPDGQPAAGCRVAAWGGQTGDPHVEQAVTADADGRFELRGVDAAIAIYGAVPQAESDDRASKMRVVHAMAFLGHPLLIHDVPPGCNDLGRIRIPALGTLTVHLEDERGVPVRSARAWWHRAGVMHGGGGCRADADGVLRSGRMPLGTAIVLRVTFEHPQHGEMEQSFRIPEVTDEAIPLRLTGAGTVIFRLHPAGAPDHPLTVSYVQFGEHDHHGRAQDGPLSELHWSCQPGSYPSLMVEAKGFRKRVIENVNVRDDGPTFLDVELEPI